MATSVSDWLDRLHPSLRPLWDLENELRKAAQNAIFLRNEEAKKHLDEARRHYTDALAALQGRPSVKPAAGLSANLNQERPPFPAQAGPPRPSGHNPN
jgi:hypothetical protein